MKANWIWYDSPMGATQIFLTVWVRATSDGPSLYDKLVDAVGEAPFESTELEGVRDMQWTVQSTNDGLAKAERLKPFCDDPALILLKVTTHFAGGSVDAVTIKDQRAELRAGRP